MFKYFESLINDAIQIEKADCRLPENYDLECTADGWTCTDYETGETIEIAIRFI